LAQNFTSEFKKFKKITARRTVTRLQHHDIRRRYNASDDARAAVNRQDLAADMR
jgi:hypothetical protein